MGGACWFLLDFCWILLVFCWVSLWSLESLGGYLRFVSWFLMGMDDGDVLVCFGDVLDCGFWVLGHWVSLVIFCHLKS